jgi:pimeloyl-ACP methyl ester carboxylesterase
MNSRTLSVAFAFAVSLAAISAVPALAQDWQSRHDALVGRLRALAPMENHWGAAWQPIYHAALPWYERWGGNPQHAVDDWMTPPETYAEELADALEHGRNFFAENPGASIPLVFATQLPDGRTVDSNYWLSLPAGFPQEGRTFPLAVGLHGSGWLGHKISFVRSTKPDSAGGRVFSVTPIDEAGPWQIDFLNAYLDELLRTLPIDADRVYLGGHSLGAMATWEWALDNPGRFAAISPRAGRGEPYRARRLRNVPTWVIHGENDDVVLTGFADQMVTALEDWGGRVRYTEIRGGAHNMPDDLDENQVLDWYLRQTRSREPIPPDPRDQLGLTPAGFSPWEVVEVPALRAWKTDPVPLSDPNAWLGPVKRLFDQVHARGERVDAPILVQVAAGADQASLWLPVPKTLHAAGEPADATIKTLPAARCARFHFRGPTKDALAHAAKVTTELRAAGYHVRDEVWITPLSLWFDTPGYLAEYRIPVE